MISQCSLVLRIGQRPVLSLQIRTSIQAPSEISQALQTLSLVALISLELLLRHISLIQCHLLSMLMFRTGKLETVLMLLKASSNPQKREIETLRTQESEAAVHSSRIPFKADLRSQPVINIRMFLQSSDQFQALHPCHSDSMQDISEVHTVVLKCLHLRTLLKTPAQEPQTSSAMSVQHLP